MKDFVYINRHEVLMCTITGTSVVLGFSIATGQPIAKFTQHELQLQAPAMLYVPDAQCLVTGGAGQGDNTLRVWDLGRELFPILKTRTDDGAEQTRRACDRLFKLLEQEAMSNGPITRWRMAVLSSVDHRACDDDHETMFGTTYDDGSFEWHANRTRLRSLEEAYDNPIGPPDWSAPPPKLIKGDRVAVWQTLRQAVLRRAFELMDINGSGSVSVTEFSKMTQGYLSYGQSPDKRTHVALSEAEIESLFDALDVDQDGSIQFDELLAMLSQDPQADVPSLPKDVPARAVLRGHTSGITSLSYMPVAMLIVSASKDGTIRLWDPISRPCRLSHPSRRPHIKQWPGYYEPIPEQWSNCAAPYSECIRLSVQPQDLELEPQARREASWRSIPQHVSVMKMHAGQGMCRVRLTEDGIRKAQALDTVAKGQQSPAATGFIYLMESGELVDIPVVRFDKRYVELQDSTLFTVADNTTEKNILQMRKVFHGRHTIQRVLYAVSNHLSSLSILRDKLAQNHAAALPKTALLNFSADFVVFYQSGDGPARDISHRFMHGFVGNGYRHGAKEESKAVHQATIAQKLVSCFPHVIASAHHLTSFSALGQ